MSVFYIAENIIYCCRDHEYFIYEIPNIEIKMKEILNNIQLTESEGDTQLITKTYWKMQNYSHKSITKVEFQKCDCKVWNTMC